MAESVYKPTTLMGNWSEDRVREKGGPGDTVFADYGFRIQTSTSKGQFLNPRDRPEFSRYQPLPAMINPASVSEVANDARRPLPLIDTKGFRAKIPTYDPTAELKYFDTTSGCDYDDPTTRYKLDCHLPGDLAIMSEAVDDELKVIVDFEYAGHKLKAGDRILDEGIMKGKLKKDMVKLSLPAILSFKKSASGAKTVPPKEERPAAGFAVIDAANRTGGMQVGLLVGESFNDSTAASKNTHVQRSWVWDNGLANIEYGGRKPMGENDTDHQNIVNALAEKKFLYRDQTDITKNSDANFLNIYAKAEAQAAKEKSAK